MNRELFDEVNACLENASVQERLVMRPPENEEIRFVDLQRFDDTPPSKLLNILNNAHFICVDPDAPQIAVAGGPEIGPLRTVSISPEYITFEDMEY